LKNTNNKTGAISIESDETHINVSDNIFKNISCSGNSPLAGAIYYYMSTISNGYYDMSGNTFIEIKTNKSVINLVGSFSLLMFSYNSFYNVSSTSQGGVYLFLYFILFYLI
jgi:hypothetical protein